MFFTLNSQFSKLNCETAVLESSFFKKMMISMITKKWSSLFSSLNYQWIIMILKMILKITFKEIYILMMRLEHSLNHHCSENDDFNDNETKCQSLFSSLIYQLIKKGSWRLHCSFLIGLDILRHFVWIWEEGDESQKNSKLLWHWIKNVSRTYSENGIHW